MYRKKRNSYFSVSYALHKNKGRVKKMPTSSLPLTNPKTYEGIDPSTKEVVGPITAQNADEIIDPAEVAKKIKNASEMLKEKDVLIQ